MNNYWDKIRNIASGLKGLATIGITDMVGNGISAIFWFYMAAILGAEHYGQVGYFLAIGSLASTIALTGGATMLSVYTAKNVRLESSVFLISIVAGSIASIVVFFIFSNLGVSFYTISAVIFNLGISEILGKKLYKSYSKYLLTQRILMVGLSIGLYYLVGINGVIIGIALGYFPYAIRIFRGFRESKIDFSLIKSRFGFWVNSYILNLSLAFNGSIDKLIIAPILGYTLLGNYQLGLQVLSVLQILPAIVNKYTLPHDASGNPNKNLKRITLLISIGFAILGIVLSPIIIPIAFPKFTKAIEVIQIVSLITIPSTINLNYQSKFFGNEKNRYLLSGSIIYILVEIVFIIVLGKLFGINGVATSILLASSAESIFYVIINHGLDKKSIKY